MIDVFHAFRNAARSRHIERASLLLMIQRAFGRSVARRAVMECPDRRELPSDAASMLGISEDELWARLAGVSILPIVRTVEPCELRDFPELCMVTDWRRRGAIPYFKEGLLTAIVCVDPILCIDLITRWGRGREIHSSLAPWSAIARALDESERRYQRDGNDVTVATEEESGSLLSEAAGKADEFGAPSFAFLLEATNASLSFSAHGRTARASIPDTARGKLERILNEASARATLLNAGAWSLMVRKASEHAFVCSFVGDGAMPPVSLDREIGRDILIVERDPKFRAVLERFLCRQGLPTRSVPSAGDSLSLLDIGALPAAIILDLQVPNSLEFLRALRAKRELDAIVIFILTADSDPETRIRCLSAGADAFYRKDEDPRGLCAQLQSVYGRRLRRAA